MYEIESRIRYSEVTKENILSPEGIVNYFQDCTTFHSEDANVGVEYLKKHQKAWILLAWQIIMERYPRLGEKIKVGTWATGFQGLYGSRNFIMQTKEGERLAYANSTWVFMDLEKGRPAKPTSEEIKPYEIEEPIQMEYAPRKIELPEGLWEEGETFTVQKHQIDSNGHVNNSQYILLAIDQAGIKESEIRQIRVEYKKSAEEKDKIQTKIKKGEQTVIVRLCGEKNETYAVVEIERK